MSNRSTAAQVDKSDLVSVRRRQSRAIKTRSKIVAAAIAEFADKGYDGASTRAIAHRADVRHALVIYHYQTKRGIWEAVMRDVVSAFYETFDRRLAGLEGVDDVTTLKLLHADFIRMSAARPELHWLMSHEAGQPGERIEWIVDTLFGGSFSIFTDLIVKAQAAGSYVDGDPTHLHYIFIGAAARIFMLSGEVEKTTGISPFDPAFIEKHIDICRALFFRDPPSASPRGKR